MVGTMYQYGDRYCDPQPSAWHMGSEYKGATNMDELNAILKARLASMHPFSKGHLAATRMAWTCRHFVTTLGD